MRIINPPSGPPDGPQIDWEQPIVKFDPWPFQEASIVITGGVYLAADEGINTDTLVDSETLTRHWPTLGRTTDGKWFIAHEDSL